MSFCFPISRQTQKKQTQKPHLAGFTCSLHSAQPKQHPQRHEEVSFHPTSHHVSRNQTHYKDNVCFAVISLFPTTTTQTCHHLHFSSPQCPTGFNSPSSLTFHCKILFSNSTNPFFQISLFFIHCRCLLHIGVTGATVSSEYGGGRGYRYVPIATAASSRRLKITPTAGAGGYLRRR